MTAVKRHSSVELEADLTDQNHFENRVPSEGRSEQEKESRTRTNHERNVVSRSDFRKYEDCIWINFADTFQL